jgi:hypothetical protein
MESDPSDAPTPPSLPVPPSQSPQPTWPGLAGGQPPTRRPPWPLIGVGAALALVVLLIAILLISHGGTTTIVVAPSASAQTATAGARATASAGGGSAISATATAGANATATAGATPAASATPTATATPSPTPTPTATATPTPAPSGPPTTHFIVAQATVNTGTPVVATCPAGEVALAGGWASNGSTPIYNSSRDGNGWAIYAEASSALVNSYVMCLQHVTGTVTQRGTPFTVAANGSNSATAACAAGEVVVGGGFAGNAGVEIYNSSASGNAWQIAASNHTGSSQPVTVYAECLRSSGAATIITLPPAQQSVGSHSSGGTQISCTGFEILSGGGFADDTNVVVYSNSPNNSTTWGADLSNQNASSNLLNVYAMCLYYA